MKKLYIILSVLIFSSGLLFAQQPAGRTANTIVADVLAQSPYERQSDYDSSMKELMNTKDKGVLQLVGMMKAPADGDNPKIEYALSGLTHYAAKDSEENRLAISNAYVKALDTTKEREILAFVIRQLDLIGKDEAVDKLATFLKEESLSGPAANALAHIGSENAKKALNDALRVTNSNSIKSDIVDALGFVGDSNAESAIKSLLNSGDKKLEQTVVQALGKVGTASSLKDLEKLAKKANFTLDHTSATGAYLNLINRLIKDGDLKNAESAAKSLDKDAKKAKSSSARQAALQYMMDIKPQEATKLALQALKDECPQYRIAALKHARTKEGNPNLISEVMNVYPKAKDDVKFTIATWLDESAKCPKCKETISASALEPLLTTLSTNNPDLLKGTTRALVKLGDSKAIEPLANLLLSNNQSTIDIAKNALAQMQGNITDPIVSKLSGASDASSIAILDLLALRKSSKHLSNVIALTNTGSDTVKDAANKTLKSLVEAKDINSMYSMLEGADKSNIAPLQDAVIAALNTMPQENRLKEISGKLAKTPENKQYLYYTALASTADVNALDIILKGFESSNKTTKNASFDALASWSNIDAAEALLNICKDKSASEYFDRAIGAYIKLASSNKLSGENRVIYLRDAMELAKTDAQKKSILNQIRNTNSFQGLIFAGKYLDQKSIQQQAAQAVMNIALNNPSYTGSEVETLLNKVLDILDNPDAGYQKEAIRKHLRENPMKNGYVSIFNGKDLTGWKGLVANPIARAKMNAATLEKEQVKADQRMVKDWYVENGCIVFDEKGYDNLCTIKEYGDFEMLVDWKLDPAGSEPDAGIYLRGTPQVQMWDISRVDVGAQVGSGGLYNNTVNERNPLKVADNKLGMWNTFYIKMVGDRVTVILNGELVVDNIILENYWDRKQPIPAIEQIELQAHGSKVFYRDIYIKELKTVEPFQLSEQEKKEGFEILFDGTNMHKWTGNTTDYTLEDGCISLVPSKGSGGNLYSKEEFANFSYRFEFQLTPGANNGIGIRTPMKGDAAYIGMEVQVLDHDNPIYANITPLQVHGSVYGVIGAKRAKLKPAGEWNYEEIIADGDNIKVILNGEVILDGNLKEAMKNGAADGLSHPGVNNKSGHIAFLGHGNPVKFKNIRVKRLK